VLGADRVAALMTTTRLSLNHPEAIVDDLLAKILTPFATGHVDLQSPAGAGINVAVYNYDGDVYATDESRMLAETGDRTFRLGNVHADSYEEMFDGELIHTLAAASCVESLPGCADCALQTYCGSDPIENYATQGNIFGHRPSSAFCRRNMEILKHLIRLYHSSEDTRRIFLSWVTGAPSEELLQASKGDDAFACAR
jgi:radical SAM protein with 4Fe4S-binding SPASM domain